MLREPYPSQHVDRLLPVRQFFGKSKVGDFQVTVAIEQ